MDTLATGKHFKTLARMGYGARGVVYLMIGGLALLTAVGRGGKTTDSRGAILEITHQPFGTALLAILVIGLLGYSVWRFTQAIKDTDDHGTSAKALAIRLGLFASGVTHTLLAFWAVKILIGAGGSQQDKQSSATENAFLQSEAGPWIMGAIGIIFFGVGIAHMFKGWMRRFEKYMDIPSDKKSWACPICRFGLIARGIVWGIVGGFFIRASLRASAGAIKGMDEALQAVHDAPYGGVLFILVAAGLFAFGIYSVLEAAYRRISTSEPSQSTK